jgi:histidinol dehydrogenase
MAAEVKSMLREIKARGEAAIGELALKFDHWEEDFVLSE